MLLEKRTIFRLLPKNLNRLRHFDKEYNYIEQTVRWSRRVLVVSGVGGLCV